LDCNLCADLARNHPGLSSSWIELLAAKVFGAPCVDLPLSRQMQQATTQFVSRLMYLAFFMNAMHSSPRIGRGFSTIPDHRWYAIYQKSLRPFWLFEEQNNGYSKKGTICSRMAAPACLS
jgi:hypothetical protein